MPDTVTLSMEVGESVKHTISLRPARSSDGKRVTKLNELGLDYFGFEVAGLASASGRIGSGARHSC